MSVTMTSSPVIAPSLFDPITHEAIKSFLNERVPLHAIGAKIDSDMDWEDDAKKFGRRFAHNVPYFVNIHRQLAPWASEQFGEPVKPSYVFLSMYGDQGIAPLHIDRPQCRYTVDYLIDCDVDEPWPIYIGALFDDEVRAKFDLTGGHPESDEEIAERKSLEDWSEIILHPNDAVLYSGTNQWHYRDRIKGRFATLAFFHFVPEAFDGPLD